MKRQQKKGTKRLTKKMKTKLVGLLIVILLALVALIFRITYISIKSGDRYTRQVLTQSSNSMRVRQFHLRGAIFWIEMAIPLQPV